MGNSDWDRDLQARHRVIQWRKTASCHVCMVCIYAYMFAYFWGLSIVKGTNRGESVPSGRFVHNKLELWPKIVVSIVKIHCLQLSFSIEKQPEWVSREGIFTSWQTSEVVTWNKNEILKFRENFRIDSSLNILDGVEVEINCKHLEHVQQRVQFSPIISIYEFQKFKLNYLKNILMQLRESFATAATCHYLLLIVPTEFLITLNAYGSAWHFLNFRHF